MTVLTDERINEIAKEFTKLMGDHWSFERGIREDCIEEFARAIEAEVLKNQKQMTSKEFNRILRIDLYEERTVGEARIQD
jgi:hypothetical protein